VQVAALTCQLMDILYLDQLFKLFLAFTFQLASSSSVVDWLQPYDSIRASLICRYIVIVIIIFISLLFHLPIVFSFRQLTIIEVDDEIQEQRNLRKEGESEELQPQSLVSMSCTTSVPLDGSRSRQRSCTWPSPPKSRSRSQDSSTVLHFKYIKQ
jgi:hypothetical protein